MMGRIMSQKEHKIAHLMSTPHAHGRQNVVEGVVNLPSAADVNMHANGDVPHYCGQGPDRAIATLSQYLVG